MRLVRGSLALALLAAAIALPTAGAVAQVQSPAPAAAGADKGTILLTIFLRHDQSKTLTEINEQLRKNGYYDKFPPPGIEVVSWYVVMGIGQVVTLKLPAERLREVNRVIEETGWGAYRTDFYPTYDFKAIAEAARAKNANANAK